MFYNVMKVVARTFFTIFTFGINIEGAENMKLIKEGPAIVCANHMSNWDPIVLVAAMPFRMYFMAKKSLFSVFFIGWFVRNMGAFPVDKEGNDVTAIKNALKILKSKQILGIFPEGRRNKDNYVHEFKDGVTLLAHKTKATVLPVGIKRQVALFRRTIIEVGKPMDFGKYYEQKASPEIYKEMNDLLHDKVCELASGEGING